MIHIHLSNILKSTAQKYFRTLYFSFLRKMHFGGIQFCFFQLGEQQSLEEAIRIASRIQQGETPGIDD